MTRAQKNNRSAMSRPVKIQCLETGKFLSGMTVDVTSQGAMVVVGNPIGQKSPIQAGEKVYVGIAWTPREVIIESENRVSATVVRSLGIDGQSWVDVQFDKPHTVAAAV